MHEDRRYNNEYNEKNNVLRRRSDTCKDAGIIENSRIENIKMNKGKQGKRWNKKRPEQKEVQCRENKRTTYETEKSGILNVNDMANSRIGQDIKW